MNPHTFKRHYTRLITTVMVATILLFSGPVTAATLTVADVMSRTNRGDAVTLEGVILREVNYETVLFSDGTGEIEVIFEEENDLPAKIMGNGQRIRIRGTVESGYKGLRVIEFDGFKILPGQDPTLVKNQSPARPGYSQPGHAAAIRTRTVSPGETNRSGIETTGGNTGDMQTAHFTPAKVVAASPPADPTVADLLQYSYKGRSVSLEGRFVKKVNFETLLFSDGTGQIEVEVAEDDHLPTGALARGLPILLHGTVETGFFTRPVYIEFDTASLLP